MGSTVIEKAFSVSDSIFLVLLIGLAVGTFWLIRYVLTKNDEREKRYIDVIDKQSTALQNIEGLREDIRQIRTDLKSIRDSRKE